MASGALALQFDILDGRENLDRDIKPKPGLNAFVVINRRVELGLAGPGGTQKSFREKLLHFRKDHIGWHSSHLARPRFFKSALGHRHPFSVNRSIRGIQGAK
jgi:hypothetical protein